MNTVAALQSEKRVYSSSCAIFLCTTFLVGTARLILFGLFLASTSCE